MARGNRRCHPRADGNHERDAAPADGPADGCLGAANQIAEPVVGNAVEAEVLVSLHPDGQLAGGGHLANESIRALHAGRATVAKGMDGRDGPLDETLKARTQMDKRYSSVTTLVIGSIAAAGPWLADIPAGSKNVPIPAAALS